jgi:hypothetical protein
MARHAKTGVWVNGILRLQSDDGLKIKEFAEEMMRKSNQVWVAPVGSFVQ